jgi:hypothetical protein
MTYSYDRRVAKDITLDLEWIENLRKDFLTLMKNIPRIKSYKDADKVRDGVKAFRKNFDHIVFETFLNHDFKYDDKVSESDRKWYGDKLRKTGWDFSIELNLPLGYPDSKYNPQSQESLFASFEMEKDKWAAKVKEKARLFWKEMKEFVEYRERVTGTPNYTVKTRDTEKVEMEGFHVSVVGYENDEDGFLERFKEGLRVFRRRAKQVFPWLLQHMLPIRLNAYVTMGEGGRYEGDHIEIAMGGFFDHKNPNIVAHVIAHEMGHHIYKVYLSEADRTFWSKAISDDAEPLDVDKLLKVWPEGAWAHELVEKLVDVDPLLALQVDVIAHGQARSGGVEFNTREDFEKLLADGVKFVTVKHPITGYGGKNVEESFCEVMGLLVGYGPATVQPIVKHWLNLIMPDVKVASDRTAREAVRAVLRRSV